MKNVFFAFITIATIALTLTSCGQENENGVGHAYNRTQDSIQKQMAQQRTNDSALADLVTFQPDEIRVSPLRDETVQRSWVEGDFSKGLPAGTAVMVRTVSFTLNALPKSTGKLIDTLTWAAGTASVSIAYSAGSKTSDVQDAQIAAIKDLHKILAQTKDLDAISVVTKSSKPYKLFSVVINGKHVVDNIYEEDRSMSLEPL